jgi:hypothetical protein
MGIQRTNRASSLSELGGRPGSERRFGQARKRRKIIDISVEKCVEQVDSRLWFERNVAELKSELEKLPTDQQEAFTKDLD